VGLRKEHPTAHTNGAGGLAWTNPAQAYDGNPANFSTATATSTPTVTKECTFTFTPSPMPVASEHRHYCLWVDWDASVAVDGGYVYFRNVDTGIILATRRVAADIPHQVEYIYYAPSIQPLYNSVLNLKIEVVPYHLSGYLDMLSVRIYDMYFISLEQESGLIIEG